MGYVPSKKEVEDSVKAHKSNRDSYHKANMLLDKRITMLQERGDLPRLPDYNIIREGDDISSNIAAVMIITEDDQKIIYSSGDGLLKKLYERCMELGKHLDSAGSVAIGRSALRQNYLDQQAFAKIEDKPIN